MKKLYVEGVLFVKFKGEVPAERALSIIAEKGASVKRFLKHNQVYHIKLKADQSVEDGIKEFSGVAEVEYAEPNFQVSLPGHGSKN
jgi:hypothetical protein